MKLILTASMLGAVLAMGFACGNGDDNGGPGPSSSSAGGKGGSAGSSVAAGGGGSGGATGGSGGSSGAGGSASGNGGAAGSAGSAGAAGNAGAGGSTVTDAGSDRADAPGADVQAGDARDGGASDAPTDGSLPYNPCPARGMPCVIMPVGDSITWGAPNAAAGGYRSLLFHLAHMNNQTITFVGSLADGPAMVDGVAFPRNHEGHSGYNIDNTQGRMGISQFFPNAVTMYKPHIILLMIGTNDVDTGEDMIPTRLATLMDTMLNADPKLLLVVAQIVPQQTAMPDTKNMQVQAFNAAIPPLVKARADAGKHVVVVDMYKAFTSVPNFSTALLADRLHPTPAGFQVMADTWYAAIRSLLR
jgi:lysophospholipase L1-like esterase